MTKPACSLIQPWSSAAAHLASRSTSSVDVEPALSRIDDFAAFVADEASDNARWPDLLVGKAGLETTGGISP